MQAHVPRRLRVFAVAGASVLVALAIGAGLFAWSGLYHVGASSGHWPITRWLLEFGLRRSVETHSLGIESPPLDDPDLIRLGAGHYAGGCAPCHGAPGDPGNPIVRSMLPMPPLLSHAVSEWSAEQLFWIVRNGLKYTGMPAWAAQERDDEVWAVVAFLRTLPGMRPEQYRALATGNAAPREHSAPETISRGEAEPALTACARCHGDGRDPPTSRLVPILAGQSPAYLRRALEEYASGARRSGIMQPVASPLAGGDLRGLAAYYGGLSRRRPESGPNASPERTRRGEAIATEGIPGRGVPACIACHSGAASAAFPILNGQPAPYLMQQLKLFSTGIRDRSTYGAIMSVIARRLTAEDARDVAAYFESVSKSEGSSPARPETPTRRP